MNHQYVFWRGGYHGNDNTCYKRYKNFEKIVASPKTYVFIKKLDLAHEWPQANTHFKKQKNDKLFREKYKLESKV